MNVRLAAPRVNVLGIGISAVNMQQAVAAITAWAREEGSRYVCVTGVHGVMESQRDPDVHAAHNGADMVTPDGMPMVWLGRLAGHRHVERVYGPDLMLACCGLRTDPPLRHFFLGSTPEVLNRLVARLRERAPHIVVAGSHSPPFRPLTKGEDADVIARIGAVRPDVLWVGLGAPKQERWMAEHRGRVSAPVMIGVGAAFDFLSGSKPQAPRWMQRTGLEWLFRLATEPRRLMGRYLLNNPAFLWYIALQATRLKRFELDPPR